MTVPGEIVQRVRAYLRDRGTPFPGWGAEHPAAFQSAVAAARCWRLRQALINGQRSRKQQAEEAEAWLQLWLAENDAFAALATYLMKILDASGHTSSLIECINGLLKMFLHNRRAFRNRDTAQAYLNLFILWHNMRVYQRGKRAGKSPYQWAGIDPGTDDWLTLLGFPATD